MVGGTSPRRFTVVRWDFRIEIDLDACCGWGTVDGSGHNVEEVLLCLLGIILPGEGGLILHAAGLYRRGRVFLFSGPSGAGKSTIARLWGGGQVLNEELCIVRSGSALQPSPPVAFSSPLIPRDGGIEPSRRHDGTPIGGLVFIHHAKSSVATPLLGVTALQRLLPRIHAPFKDRSVVEGLLGSAQRLVGGVPCLDMGVSLRDGIWDSIEAMSGDGSGRLVPHAVGDGR